MRVYNNILELIGNTPIVKINKLNTGLANIFAKIESFNPTGSIKDRAALSMIEDAEKKGIINSETIIIEPTSGNTGIGLALVCLIKGYKLILTMPDTMSKERIDLLKAYGAQIYLSEGILGMKGAIDLANQLKEENPNSFIPQQFSNVSNSQVHYETTANEIWEDMDGKIDIFVSTFGTGGTISGTARRLKELNPEIKIVGIEPLSSPLLTQGRTGAHKIQGIGANFVPEILEKDLIDEFIAVSDEDSVLMTKNLCLKEGIFAGISSGAALVGANIVSSREKNKGKNIVVILPDSGSRYLSCNVFN